MKLSSLTAGTGGLAVLLLALGTWTPADAGAPVPPAPVSTEAVTFQVDSGHSSVLFNVKHMEVSHFYGRFNRVEGEIVYDEAKPESSSVKIEIPANSIDTNSEKRDQHLLSPDFLDAKQFPRLKFTSTKVERDGALWKVTGDLAFHGTQQEVTFDMEVTGEGEARGGGKLMGFLATFEIDRTEWGMEYSVGPISKEIEITVSLEAKSS